MCFDFGAPKTYTKDSQQSIENGSSGAVLRIPNFYFSEGPMLGGRGGGAY